MIATTGYHSIPMSEYLADPCEEPALSTRTVCALDQQSPLHAWTQHPRFGKKGSESTARGDLGSAVHSLALGGDPVVFAPREFEDWKKKAAQEFRDSSRELRQIPLLDRQQYDVSRAAESVKNALLSYGTGSAEQTLIWQQQVTPGEAPSVWARGRADWLDHAGTVDIDVKTVDSLDPGAWMRQNIIPNGNDVQAALRSLGHVAIQGRARTPLWLLVELEAPYDVAFVGLSPGLLDLAQRKVARAASIWRRCLDENRWPGFSKGIYAADLPAYAAMDFAARSAVAQ